MTHRMVGRWQLLMIWCLVCGATLFAPNGFSRNRPPKSYMYSSCPATSVTLTSYNDYYVYTEPLLEKQYQVKTSKVGTTTTPSDVVIEGIALQLDLGKSQAVSALGITVEVVKIFPNQHLELKVASCVFGRPAVSDDQPVVQKPLPLVSAGNNHTCTNVTGVLQCWGANFSGELGSGTLFVTPGFGPVEVSPAYTGVPSTTVPPLSDTTAIAAGASHTCIVNQSGEVYCWGTGFWVPPPNLMDYSSKNPEPELVEGFSGPVRGVSVDSHACAVLDSGQVYCWGNGVDGQLGEGNMGDYYSTSEPGSPVIGLTGVASVAVRGSASCALKADGTVWCWGSNAHGIFGVAQAAMEASAVPVQVSGLPMASELVMGYEHACIIANGGVWCWGRNKEGQLGTGSVADGTFPPQQVSNLAVVQTLAAGGRYTCAVQASGEVKCWGSNTMCALGIGVEGGVYPKPQAVTVKDAAGSLRLSAGREHTCVLLKDQTTVKCWGANKWGKLGLGTVPQGSGSIEQKVKDGFKTDENGVPYYVCGE